MWKGRWSGNNVCRAKDKIYLYKTLRILIYDIPISREISHEILHVSFSTVAIMTIAYWKSAVLAFCRRLVFTSVLGVTVLFQKVLLLFLKHFTLWTSRTKKMQCEIPCFSTREFTFNPECSHHVILIMCAFDHNWALLHFVCLKSTQILGSELANVTLLRSVLHYMTLTCRIHLEI